jgi:LysR family hydrogen peroxide-inducible transcriptional activator
LREPFYLVVPASHSLSRRKTVRLEDIPKDSRFLLLKEGHCFRDSTIAACEKSKLVPNVVFESGQFSTILAMVAAGTGISAVPRMAVQPARGCRFIRISSQGAARTLGIAMLSRHFQTKAHKTFLQHLLRAGAGFERPM